MAPAHTPKSASGDLHRLRGDFSPGAAAAKAGLILGLHGARISQGRELLALHDELLYLVAFPDNPQIARVAQRELESFHARVHALPSAELRHLADSGIAGSTTTHTFMFGVSRWLADHGEHAEVDWPSYDDPERLDSLVRLSLLPAESDAFESGEWGTLEWMRLASAQAGDVLRWLAGACPPHLASIARELYDNAELPVAWSIRDSHRSVTLNRAPGAQLSCRTGFRRVPADPVAFIAKSLTRVGRVNGDASRQWTDASIAALVARCREVSPTIYHNPHEVYVADLGEGAQLCVIGAHPDDRLALEANYGYVMFSNGVPIGYGGVTPLADQANTGANIFEAFRRSEAPYLFAQALRAFRGLFGVSRFVVNPYQFGEDNDEALQSGAFWFYDRLGFRPVDREVRLLADRERARLRANPGARTPLATLRALARSDVVLDLDPASRVPLFDEGSLARLGPMVAREFASVPAGARNERLAAVADAQARHLGGVTRQLTAAERRGARLLSPIVALVEGTMHRWTAEERRAIWALVRAKGAVQERTFARLARAHAPFWRALERVVGRPT